MIVNDNFIHYYFTSILISLLGFTGVFALNTLLFWHDRSEVTLAAFLKIPPSCESIRSLAQGVSNSLRLIVFSADNSLKRFCLVSLSICSNLQDLDISKNLTCSIACLKDLGALVFVEPVAATRLDVIFTVGRYKGSGFTPSLICKILR